MYVHTYIHTYIHTYVYTYVHIHIHTYTHTHIHTYTHTYIHTYTHTCLYICTCIHTYVHTYIHTFLHMYIHTYIYNIRIYIHMYRQTYVYTYIHIHIHAYMHTCKHTLSVTFIVIQLQNTSEINIIRPRIKTQPPAIDDPLSPNTTGFHTFPGGGQKLVAAVNNLVEREELVAWSRMAEDLRENTVTKLLHTVEQSALALARGSSSTPVQLETRASDMGERPSTRPAYRFRC